MNPLTLSSEQVHAALDAITALAGRWLDELDDHRITPEARGADVAGDLGALLPEQGEGLGAIAALEDVMRCSRAQNGRFFGYVLGSGEPVAVAADLLASALNQNVTAWRSAPAAVTIEKAVVASLAAAIGCAGFSGSLTGGGSSANLMGLAIAREARAPANEAGAQKVIAYASSEVHMSIPRAIALLGIGREQLRLLPASEDLKLGPEVLERAIDEDLRRGLSPFLVVGSAGTVNTGAIDPLDRLAEIAHARGLWFHVDGAYGALSAIARPIPGLDGADSLSLDAHKWLYQPLDCGCLLYRDREAARRTFSFAGDYARSLAEDPLESFAFFDETAELSRRFRALKLWLSWRFHGLSAFRRAIADDLRHAQLLVEEIRADSALELLAKGELSAVCFRSLDPRGERDRDAFNRDLLTRLNERGRVYLSNATIRGQFALRACFTNHRTTDDDVREIVREVRATVEAL